MKKKNLKIGYDICFKILQIFWDINEVAIFHNFLIILSNHISRNKRCKNRKNYFFKSFNTLRIFYSNMATFEVGGVGMGLHVVNWNRAQTMILSLCSPRPPFLRVIHPLTPSRRASHTFDFPLKAWANLVVLVRYWLTYMNEVQTRNSVYTFCFIYYRFIYLYTNSRNSRLRRRFPRPPGGLSLAVVKKIEAPSAETTAEKKIEAPSVLQMVLNLPHGHEDSEYVFNFEIGQRESGFYSARTDGQTHRQNYRTTQCLFSI